MLQEEENLEVFLSHFRTNERVCLSELSLPLHGAIEAELLLYCYWNGVSSLDFDCLQAII